MKGDAQCPEKWHKRLNDLSSLPKVMKIEKFEKLVVNLYDQTEYIMQKVNLKQSLNHGLFLKNLHRIVKKRSKKSIWKRFF